MHASKIPYQNTGLTIKKEYAVANPKIVDGFTRAIIEAYGYIFQKENKQSVKEIIARNLRLRNVEAAEDFYIEALEELDRKPYPTLEGSRSSSNTSPSKTRKPPPSKPKRSSTAAG